MTSATMTATELEKYIGELEKENKKLRGYVDNLDSENDNQAIEIEELKKENKKLKSDLEWYQKHYGPKPLTTIEEVQNYEGNTIWG